MARSATSIPFPPAAAPRPAAIHVEHTRVRARAQILDGAGRTSPRALAGAAAIGLAWVVLWTFFLLAVVRPAAALHAHGEIRAQPGSVAYHATP